jgi:hypothetical protein
METTAAGLAEPATPTQTTLRAAPSLLSVLSQGQGLASRLQAAAQGAAQGAASGLQAAAADAQALARSTTAALSALPGLAAGGLGGAFGGAAAAGPPAPVAGAEEAALRGRELRGSAEAANARWLAREVDYATTTADAYARTLREVALNKQALRP